ncbi:hypothetical protein C8Q80DRAFT_1267783 [Daedaleopsis nitida]|nr:hypothetical protein C8Q80DRAFT_1267783 [Daedaleopsis nitida]
MAATWRLSFDLLSPALIVEPCSALAAQVLVDAPARLKNKKGGESSRFPITAASRESADESRADRRRVTSRRPLNVDAAPKVGNGWVGVAAERRAGLREWRRAQSDET